MNSITFSIKTTMKCNDSYDLTPKDGYRLTRQDFFVILIAITYHFLQSSW